MILAGNHTKQSGPMSITATDVGICVRFNFTPCYQLPIREGTFLIAGWGGRDKGFRVEGHQKAIMGPLARVNLYYKRC